MSGGNLRFGEEHLRLFSIASHDISPLHTSAIYARRTPFGERLVYGSLAFATCLSRLRVPAGKVPASVTVEYKGPMVLDVDYSLQVTQEASGVTKVNLMDGSVTVMRARLRWRDGAPKVAALQETGAAPRTVSRETPAEFPPSLRYVGQYGPPRTEYLELLHLLGVDRVQWGDAILVATLCASYLSGMEIPGASGASSAFKAEFPDAAVEPPSDFEVELNSHDPRFGLVESRFSLSTAAGTYARGTVAAIVRPALAAITAPQGSEVRDRFAGKTAVVIGASRGLGAAIALELAARGCTVFGVYSQCREEAEAVRDAAGALPGRLILEQGDASDAAWCASLASRIERLDLMVCNAAPAIPSVRMESAHYGRIQDYLSRGIALVGTPLAGFVEQLAVSEGGVLLVSAEVVETPPSNRSHFVALKAAVEGLVRGAASDHPKMRFWIARPRKIETDSTNTPMGRLDAEQPATVARRIVDHVADNTAPGCVHFFA